LRGELPLTNADVNALITFIETETGRPFLYPPSIVAESSEVFLASIVAEAPAFERENVRDIRKYQSLGLTTLGEQAVRQAFRNLLTSPDGIQGYYDPSTDELYLPLAGRPDDEVRALLVHELTHALDGQYQSLTVLGEIFQTAEATGNFDPIAGFRAVAEGRATAVENRWRRATGIGLEPVSFERQAGIPAAILVDLAMPYLLGERYIEAKGGPAATWDLLANPPQSTEEIFVPAIDVSRLATIEVNSPTSDGPVIERATFGASDMYLWLTGTTFEPDPAYVARVLQAVDGWAGGKSVVWGDDQTSCTRIVLVADTEQDLIEIVAIAQDWADQGDDRLVEPSAERVTVTACAPYIP